jgi:hypothetical protein
MAIAASLFVVAVAGVLLLDVRRREEQAVSPAEARAQSGGLAPRLQTPTDPQGNSRPGRAIEPADRVAVLIQGNDREAAIEAESVLLRSLAGQRGFRPLDADGLSLLRRNQAGVQAAADGDFAPLASVGRDRGVELVVVGELTSRSVARGNQSYSGFAELRARMYRVSDRTLGEERTFVTGAGGVEASVAETATEARVRAARNAATQAAEAAGNWLARPLP